MKLNLVIGLLLLSLPGRECLPLTATSTSWQSYNLHQESYPNQGEMQWLQRFGYLPPTTREVATLQSRKTISTAIAKLQRFAGLSISGELDEETRKLLKTSRCGLPDFEEGDNLDETRQRRFVTQGTKWLKKNLTWTLNSANNDGLTKSTVEAILEAALMEWALHAQLNFTKVAEKQADIVFSFVNRSHGDSFPFDGKGGVLAHAFYPHTGKGLAGDVHFDDDEKFTHKSAEGKNLDWIALHEIGHSLGLKHSSDEAAVMFPWYPGYSGKKMVISEDDIKGIQTLYGARNNDNTQLPSTDLTPTEQTKEASSFCVQRVKAIFQAKDGRLFIINGDQLYILGKYLDSRKGPIRVGSYFNGVGSVDAAYTRLDGKTVLFTGRQFYVFDGRTKISGPTRISEKYRGFPDKIEKVDGAFVLPTNGRTYLFTGDNYWRYDPISQRIDDGFPRPMESVWTGVPSSIDAVFSWMDGKTYFFKGSKYYQMQRSPTVVAPGFPKDIAQEWMLCPAGVRENNEARGSGAALETHGFFRLVLSTTLLLIGKVTAG